jgi:hypothetical protein
MEMNNFSLFLNALYVCVLAGFSGCRTFEEVFYINHTYFLVFNFYLLVLKVDAKIATNFDCTKKERK